MRNDDYEDEFTRALIEAGADDESGEIIAKRFDSHRKKLKRLKERAEKTGDWSALKRPETNDCFDLAADFENPLPTKFEIALMTDENAQSWYRRAKQIRGVLSDFTCDEQNCANNLLYGGKDKPDRDASTLRGKTSFVSVWDEIQLEELGEDARSLRKPSAKLDEIEPVGVCDLRIIRFGGFGKQREVRASEKPQGESALMTLAKAIEAVQKFNAEQRAAHKV